jgi:hypothetical protein
MYSGKIAVPPGGGGIVANCKDCVETIQSKLNSIQAKMLECDKNNKI